MYVCVIHTYTTHRFPLAPFNKMRMYIRACSHSRIQACVHTHTHTHTCIIPAIYDVVHIYNCIVLYIVYNTRVRGVWKITAGCLSLVALSNICRPIK